MEDTDHELVDIKSPSQSGWVWRILVALLILGSGGFILREFAHARQMAALKQCQENLTQIDGAKEQWALEYNKAAGEAATFEDLDNSDSQVYRNIMPRNCPSRLGTYIINPIGTDPSCTSELPGHALSEVGEPITSLE